MAPEAFIYLLVSFASWEWEKLLLIYQKYAHKRLFDIWPWIQSYKTFLE